MKITQYDLFKSAFKIRLEDCVNYVIESNKLHNSKLDFIEDELSESFYRELNAIDYSVNFGIINTYSLFDFFLSSFCKKIQENSNIDVSKVKGDNENIKRAKIINFIIGFDIRKHESWKSIDDYRKIRNLLIHNNLNLYSNNKNLKINPDKKTEELIKIISENPYLELDKDSGKIFVEDLKFIINFKNNVLNLFDELIINTPKF
ncbi:hypothetical protein [Flavobacterium sp.]|uniref:hypothetical protein n=1 Tax=Flavobacterium sp. TaxID=239 RepID=UPI00261BFE57|nr:hypothetical protein [Flavobacterium sp.]MDD3005955.1 hypothetical protein [Flavobacterium sp.]